MQIWFFESKRWMKFFLRGWLTTLKTRTRRCVSKWKAPAHLVLRRQFMCAIGELEKMSTR